MKQLVNAKSMLLILATASVITLATLPLHAELLEKTKKVGNRAGWEKSIARKTRHSGGKLL